MNRWLSFVALLGLGAPAMAMGATYQTLVTFAANPRNGGGNGAAGLPTPLLFDKSGAIYGAISGLYPSVYKLTPPVSGGGKWTIKTLFAFPKNIEGGECVLTSGVVMDAAGNIYGIGADCWGANDDGAVYQLSPPKTGNGYWSGREIYEFGAKTVVGYTDGQDLQIGPAGNLLGASGAFYKLTRPKAGTGNWTATILAPFLTYSFVLNTGNAFYAEAGGSETTYGRIVQITYSAGQWVSKELFNFDSTVSGNSGVGRPAGGVVRDKAGNLYGTVDGGANGIGAVFELSPPTAGQTNWALTVPHSFQISEGHYVQNGLVADATGSLYGVTACGGKWAAASDGNSGEGSIFKMTPPATPGGTWTFSVVYQPGRAFYPKSSCAGLSAINGHMVLGPDGALYGTANGPANSGGSVFRLVP